MCMTSSTSATGSGRRRPKRLLWTPLLTAPALPVWQCSTAQWCDSNLEFPNEPAWQAVLQLQCFSPVTSPLRAKPCKRPANSGGRGARPVLDGFCACSPGHSRIWNSRIHAGTSPYPPVPLRLPEAFFPDSTGLLPGPAARAPRPGKSLRPCRGEGLRRPLPGWASPPEPKLPLPLSTSRTDSALRSLSGGTPKAGSTAAAAATCSASLAACQAGSSHCCFLPKLQGAARSCKKLQELLAKNLQEAARSCKKLQEAARSCKELGAGSSKKLQGAARSCKELQEAARSCKELQEAARSCKELGAGSCKKLQGAARSWELPAPSSSP